MKRIAVTLGASLLALSVLPGGVATAESRMQQSIQKVDVKRVQRFCDVGFRFTESGIKFDMDKLLGLGLQVDPKVLQAVTSQAAVQIAVLTHLCRMAAAGFITPDAYVQETRRVLEYAKDLEAVRSKAEETAKTPVSKKEDGRLDPAQVAEAELNLKVESSIDTGGQLPAVLRRLTERYACLCLPEKR